MMKNNSSNKFSTAKKYPVNGFKNSKWINGLNKDT
jgi:hypothetical protein